MIIDKLKDCGEFLQLSRRDESLFSEPLQFTLANQTQVDILAPGIVVFTPSQCGDKNIVLSSGIHGNETAPIEICDELVKGVLTEQIQLAQRVMFLFGNLPAMDIAQRFVEENMNRLFCGAHQVEQGKQNYERQRAALLERCVEQFFLGRDGERYHYDLHTAIRASKNDKFAVYPFLHEREHNLSQLGFLSSCGVNTILLSQSPTTTFSYFSSHKFNAHAFTVELGKVRPFGENDMSQFEQVRHSLRQLLCDSEYQFPQFQPEKMWIYRVNQVINKQHSDFKLHFADDTPNFSDYPKGTVLASETGTKYRAEQDGEAIVFPNADVAIGQRALLTVVPTTLI